MDEVEIGVVPRGAVQPSAASVKARIRIPGNPVLEAFLREVCVAAFAAAYGQGVAPEIAEAITFDVIDLVMADVEADASRISEPKRFYKLAVTVAHNRAVDHRKKEGPLTAWPALDGEVLEASMLVPDPAADLEAKELEVVISAAIAALPPKCRLVFVHSVKGKRNREIAELLEISENTVANQLAKARAWVRLALNRYEAGLPTPTPPKRGPRKVQ